tara:strand:- start:207 stop:1154 length:948 start_codon:yes stop_codon:yes gene_type:complete
MINYGEHITFSLRSLRDNKKLVLPDVYSGLVQLPFFLLAVIFSGIGGAIYAFVTTNDPTVIASFFQTNLAQFLIAWIGFFIVSYVIGAGFEAMRYNMVKGVVEKGEVKVRFASKNRFINLVFVKLIFDIIKWVFLGFVFYLSLPFLRELMSNVVLKTVVENISEGAIVSIFVTIIVGFFLLVIYGVVAFFALFRFASLFLDNTNFLHAIKNSFSLVKHNFLFAIIIMLILLLGRILLSVVIQAINLAFRMVFFLFVLLATVPFLAWAGYFGIGLFGLLFGVIVVLISIAYLVLIDLFLFSTYNATKKLPENQKRT